MITNMINSKTYIGQTNNIKRRWSRHKYEAFTKNNSKPLYRSMRKHGISNFSIQTIICSSKHLAGKLEIFCIQLFASDKKEFGYNLTKGGQLQNRSVKIGPKKPPMLGKKHSIETKQKMSQQRQGKNNAFYGKKHSDSAKKKMSQNTNRRYVGDKNPFYGKHFYGSKNSFSKLTEDIVLAARKAYYEEGLTFTELSKLYDVSESTISRAIRGITWSHI